MNFLTKIEYLSGFDDENNMNTPNWKSLTLDVYRNNSDRNLLCRIKPYHHERLGIRVTNTKSPIFDSVFIIKPVEFFSVETGIERDMMSASGEFANTAVDGAFAVTSSNTDAITDKQAQVSQLGVERFVLRKRKALKEEERDRLEADRLTFTSNPENIFNPTGSNSPRLTPDAKFVVENVYEPQLRTIDAEIADLHVQIRQKTEEIEELERQVEELERQNEGLEGFIN
tara:strand:- start:6 stop:689 length:684 start_codon:yes stop_codon:yes gene_type:complete